MGIGKTGILLGALAWAATAASNHQIDSQRGPSLTFTAVAVDARNQPVRDLRASEFRISDNGKILRPDAVRLLDAGGSQAAPLGPHEYSNRIGGNSQSTLVLLDLLNANLGERGFASTDIVSALQNFESAEHLYLYLLTKDGSLHPVHGLPAADSEGAEERPWTAGIKPLLDNALNAVSRLRPQEYQVDADLRTQRTFALLHDLVSEFGAQPGRKALVWISHGVPLLAYSVPRGVQTDYTATVRNLAGELTGAGISVYPVDQLERATSGMESKDTLWQLAELTGGAWFPSDFVAKAIAQAALDAHAMYRIAYVAAASNWDGKYHRLRVTCDRKGVQIRAMAGYDAAIDASPLGRYAQAALGISDAQDIGIRATVTPSAKVPGWMHLQIHVDARDITLDSGDLYAGRFRVAFVDYVTEWGPNVDERSPVQVDLTAEQLNLATKDGIAVVLDRAVNLRARMMRVVIQDSASGAAGSVTIPISAVRTPQ